MIKRADIPVADIFKFFKLFWETWNIQAVVLASLGFQVVLIFTAPSRVRKKKTSCFLILWSFYLLADYFATFAIGLINNGGNQMQQSNSAAPEAGPANQSCNSSGQNKHNSIAAFWAPFLLLHLGGPDTITAFAIEDNELWHRHMLSLIVQVLSVLLVFYRYQILTHPFLIPTMLTFAAGIIKYAERTRSLNLASLANLKKSMRQEPDAGPDYAQLMEEMESKQNANLPVTIDISREKGVKATEEDVNTTSLSTLQPLEVVVSGYKFYKTFRGLIVDHMFSFLERNESRNFFLSLNYEDAFRVMEVELNFMYDAMFTKTIAIFTSYGYAFRFICTALIVAATVVFSRQQAHQHIQSRDLIVTYFLLFGGVALDIIAIVELIFSEWTICLLMNPETTSLTAKSLTAMKKAVAKKINQVKRFLSSSKRWSGEIQQYSLINHCLNKRPKWLDAIFDVFGLIELINSCLYSTTREVEPDLKKLIFNEIREKGKQAEKTRVAKEISLSKGEWSLLDYRCGPAILSTVSQEVEYDECVLMWHIATEIFYFSAKEEEKEGTNAYICRYISEYLVYLLVMEKKMTSAVGGIVEIRFRDTCEEAVNFFTREQQRSQHLQIIQSLLSYSCLPTSTSSQKDSQGPLFLLNKRLKSMVKSTWEDIMNVFTLSCFRGNRKRTPTEWEQYKNSEEDKRRAKACKRLQSVKAQVKPAEVKGDRSKSLLFDACILASNLEDLCREGGPYSEKEVWKMMSRVWVELLSYGACCCRGDAHAQYLNRGGELLTFVWLLMAHFGLGDQFRIEAGHARAKLIVGKEKN